MRMIPVFLAVGAVAAGCGAASGAKDKTSVVAAFYPLAFVAEQIGGPSVAVHNLTPPGAEPHDIELTPGDVGRLQQADVVLYLSHGFQPAVEQAARGTGGKRVDVLAGLGLRQGVGDEAGKSDPHVWLDPVLFARIVRQIGAGLGERARAAVLARCVLALDAAYRRGLAHCARRDFVTSHAAFGYLAAPGRDGRPRRRREGGGARPDRGPDPVRAGERRQLPDAHATKPASATERSRMPLAVEFRGVEFAYPHGPPVLREADLQVEAGEVLAIAGPNGGGKTTLLRLALGLEHPTRGAVRLFGEPAARFGERARLGYLPQRAQ